MGLYQRKDSPTYWMNYTANGRRVFESTKTKNRKLAEKIYAKRITEITEGRWFPNETRQEVTFSELADRYVAWMQGRQKSAKIKGYIIGQLRRRYSGFKLGMFTMSTIEQLQTDYLRRECKPASVNKVTSVLKHMFTKAVEWDMTGEETLKRVRKAKPLRGENKRLKYLAKDEMQRLVESCDAHLKPLVITALNTGMRKSEILNLTWEQLDFKHGFILLAETKNGERREIPMNETLRHALHDIIRRLDIPYVFYNPLTEKPYRKDLKKSFNTALRRAGIKDFHFHDLRHTFASQLVMAGVDITTVKELLGHKTLTMTLRYAHLAPSHMVRAVEVLDRKGYDFVTLAGAKELQAP